jgi:hypothetical protein
VALIAAINAIAVLIFRMVTSLALTAFTMLRAARMQRRQNARNCTANQGVVKARLI